MISQESVQFARYLKMDLPKGQSTFLWGARKTGKTSYLKAHYPDSVFYNLLETDQFIRLLKEPYQLRNDILGLDKIELEKPIIIDEVQKIPMLMDEVHWLIEEINASFILCGSSARKLKRKGVNLLGGRAWRYEFYPLVYPEIPQFDLLHALNNGLVPSHYLAQNWKKTIKAYINDYLKEEIKEEGLSRNLAAFAKFIDVAAFSNGELLNYANIARDCGIDAKTVKEYYRILEDTLLGYHLHPYRDKKKRHDIVASSKFYFFDVGIVNGLTKRTIAQLKGNEAGSTFEHYILMELLAHRGLNDLDHDIYFWRTSFAQEVDFILGEAEVAIEVKISDRIRNADIRGLIVFKENYNPKRTIVVNMMPRKQKIKIGEHSVEVMPWNHFLEMLWAGEII